jgi:hypothetical protein
MHLEDGCHKRDRREALGDQGDSTSKPAFECWVLILIFALILILVYGIGWEQDAHDNKEDSTPWAAQ